MAVFQCLEWFTTSHSITFSHAHCRDGCVSRGRISPILVSYYTLLGAYIALLCFNRVNSLSNEIISNKLLCASAFLTFATTLITTLLIVFRILSVSQSKENVVRRKRPFMYIVHVLTESAAIYAATALVYAISQLLVGRPVIQQSWFAMLEYTTALFSAVSVCTVPII